MDDHAISCKRAAEVISSLHRYYLREVGFSSEKDDITNKRCAFGVDDSTWEKVEVVLFAVHDHRVPRVVPALPVKRQID